MSHEEVRQSIAQATADAYRAELMVTERASEAIASRVGLEALPTRCVRERHATLDLDRTRLTVDGVTVWECWWERMPEPAIGWELRSRWLVDPERID